MGAPKYLLSVGSATFTTVPSMMFMNIAATNTALTTTFWLAARPEGANFTNYSSAPDPDLFPLRTKKSGFHRTTAGRLWVPGSSVGGGGLAPSWPDPGEPEAGDAQADQADQDQDAHVGPPLGRAVRPQRVRLDRRQRVGRGDHVQVDGRGDRGQAPAGGRD